MFFGCTVFFGRTGGREGGGRREAGDGRGTPSSGSWMEPSTPTPHLRP